MNSLNDIRAYLSQGYRIANLIAIVLVVLIVIGYLLFIRTSITPSTQASQDLTNRLAAAKKDLRQKQSQLAVSPQKLQDDLKAAQALVAEQSKMFVTEAQAAGILDLLYQYAADAGVDIVDLQSRPLTQTQPVAVGPPTTLPPAPTVRPPTAQAGTTTPAAKGQTAPAATAAPKAATPTLRPTAAPDRAQGLVRALYDPKVFRLVVQGSVLGLTDFVARIREASNRAVAISNVALAEGPQGYTLTMDLTLYVSTLASTVVAPPAANPTGTPAGIAAGTPGPALPAPTTAAANPTAAAPRPTATLTASPGPSVNPLLVRPTNWPTDWPWPPRKPGTNTPAARGTSAAQFALQADAR